MAFPVICSGIGQAKRKRKFFVHICFAGGSSCIDCHFWNSGFPQGIYLPAPIFIAGGRDGIGIFI
jgi:hypothetical protein